MRSPSWTKASPAMPNMNHMERDLYTQVVEPIACRPVTVISDLVLDGLDVSELSRIPHLVYI